VFHGRQLKDKCCCWQTTREVQFSSISNGRSTGYSNSSSVRGVRL